jgi:hypothetical protein
MGRRITTLALTALIAAAPGLALADRDDRRDSRWDDRWDRKDRYERWDRDDRRHRDWRSNHWRRNHWRDDRHWSAYRAVPRHRWYGGWYTAPRHPWYPRYPYRDRWYWGPGVIGGAIIGSAITGSLLDDNDCRDCVRYRDPQPTREITGCYRLERTPDGYERRIELPASDCRR